MRIFTTFLMIAFAYHINAQSIRTTFKDDIQIYPPGSKTLKFNIGDSVTIHAYKKKSDKYNFIIETEEYAVPFDCLYIPFNVDEKKLKKLPNALGEDAKIILENKKLEVENRKHNKIKVKALSGQFKVTLGMHSNFHPYVDAVGKLDTNDEVYILGFKEELSLYKWALYANNAVGVFITGVRNAIKLDKETVINYLPSIDDPDVEKIIQEKKAILLQKIKEQKEVYRNKALKEGIMGIIAVNTLGPYSKGDIVKIVGFSSKEMINDYALYSEKAAGIFSSSSSANNTFKNSGDIKFDYLPAVDDSDVKALIETKRKVFDSLEVVETAKFEKELIESKQELINVMKKRSPVFVKCDSWSSNSAGGIEVSVTVTNCSEQTIKYITIQGYFLNAVGDKCRNEIGGGTVWKARGIGPIGPRPTTVDNLDERWEECRGSYTFDNLTFYSRIADTFHFSSVTIQYMNGKTITLSGKALESHVSYD